ncbi:MAG: NADH-quinone oxidoreductase subunit K [Gemmatimonadaceae bacterium]
MLDLIRTLSLAMILTAFVTVESRSLRRALTAYMAQALLMVAVIAGFATIHPPLAIWAVTAFVTKFGLVSWVLWREIRRGSDEEVAPRVGPLASAVIVGVLAVAGYRFVHANVAFLAPTPTAEMEPFRTNVAVSLTLLAIGIYAIVTRRDALKVVLGVCLMENGAHLSLVSLATTMHETVLIGIVTDVVVAVVLLLYFIRAIAERLGTRDSSQLALLKG